MNDAQRYRMNAAECLSAAERCGPAYRDLTVSIEETWLALARHQEAMDELLATWGTVQAAAPARLPSSNSATLLAVGSLRFKLGKQFQPKWRRGYV
jgi:hypothetical protein